ncbi:hypothetical protein QTP88_009830 [Uroleucon formosanum]
MTMISINIEGLTPGKENILAELCKTSGCENNEDGEKVEDWAERENMSLIHDAKLPPSFNSGRCWKGYNPDNIFVSHNIRNMSIKLIIKAIPKTQYRPIQYQINAVIIPRMSKECLKKIYTKGLPHQLHQGTTTRYHQGLKNLVRKGIAEECKKEWMTLIKDLNMFNNNNKAWKLIKSMNNEKQQPKEHINITPDQIAHKLLTNGKTKTKGKKTKLKFKMDMKNNTSEFNKPFEMDQLNMVIGVMKNRKAAGIDGIMTEQIKQLGPKANEWLLNMFNNCIKTDSIPTEWLKSHVMALLKPGKAPTDASNFRPVSLLCHTYKMFERMILNRIKDKIDGKLIKQETGLWLLSLLFYLIDESDLEHKHDEETKQIVRQVIRTTTKRKAIEDTSIRPSKIVISEIENCT